jgi:hypothetical protein
MTILLKSEIGTLKSELKADVFSSDFSVADF